MDRLQKQHFTVGLTFLFAALLLAFLLSGCANLVSNLYKSVGTVAAGVSVGYRSLDKLDKDTQLAVVAKARNGDPAGARNDLDAWLKKYTKAKLGLDAASLGAENAIKAIPAIEAAAAPEKRKSVFNWIATLTKLGLDVVSSLGEIGIKVDIPGFGTLPAPAPALAPSPAPVGGP